jgi:type III secretion protein V
MRIRQNIPFGGALALVARYSDVMLGLILMAILALLVLPLPPFLIDLAIASNFIFAMLLLASSIYIASPLDLAAFPSLLLLTTLFRLGLAVATTKMILLHAHAGDVIQTFGRIVVGGNVVVGLVIFSLLCAVQIVVVAKGSDRVAEVAARFTLDAIPGKQMSIDADLRSGAISGAEAKARRERLQQETQLHGALDGAMKFVKGDAVIGILIALVNIIGGIVIGTAGRGLSFGEAVQTYVVLTVGDGLVSQLPSLIVSIAAGFIITRGDDEASGGGHLGRRVFEQLTRQRKPVLMASVAALAFACIPGFPHLQFLALAAALLVIGVAVRQRDHGDAPAASVPMENTAREGAVYRSGILDSVEMGTSVPLCVRISREAFDALDAAAFDRALGELRERLMRDLGLPFPGLSMKGDPALGEGAYVIDVEDQPVARGVWPVGHVFVRRGDEPVAPPAAAPGIGEGAWMEPPAIAEAGIDRSRAVPPHDLLAAHLGVICTGFAAAFMGTQEAKNLLTRLAVLFPDLVESLQATLSPTELAGVLRELLREGVSIRNLRAIGEALLVIPCEERIPARMVQAARVAVGRQIVLPLVEPGTRRLAAVLLDGALERFIADRLKVNNRDALALAMDPEEVSLMHATFSAAARRFVQARAVVTSALVRPYVAEMAGAAGWNVPVLSIKEIPFDEIELQHLGVIEAEAAP